MSTLASSSPAIGLRAPAAETTLAPAAGATPGVYRARRNFDGARGLAAMLLAALVAAMVVVADHLISTWADGHLLMAWVVLWVVVFAGLALFANTARSMARSALRSLDAWSQSMAHARAEARLWDMARSDPRLMSELVHARMRESDETDTVAVAAADDFSAALAPLGMDTHTAVAPVGGWDRFVERMAEQRHRNLHLHYI